MAVGIMRGRRAGGPAIRSGGIGCSVIAACLSIVALVVPAGAIAQALPDGRAYEMVSPLQKNNADAGTPKGETLFITPIPRQAASAGDAVSYASYIAFGPEAQSAPLVSQLLSRRTPAGWRTENLDPPFEEGYLRDPVIGLSPDLAHAALAVRMPVLTADADKGISDLYSRSNGTGTLTALTAEPPAPHRTVSVAAYCVGLGGASTDFSHVFFKAKGALLPGDVAADGYNLYEWSTGEGLKLVSTLPDGTRAVPRLSTDFGNGSFDAKRETCNPENSDRRHAVAADGSRAFWTYGEGTYGGAPSPLFAWSATGTTVQLDRPNQGVPGAGGNGVYWDASADGAQVFFTDEKQLTADSSPSGGQDLYVYDFGAPLGQRLTDLSADALEPAEVQGLAGASADGDYAYFVAKGALTPPSEENEHGEHAEAGRGNLYVWHRGEGLRFIAQLELSVNAVEPQDSGTWVKGGDFTAATSGVAPSGRQLAFLSVRSLTGYDNNVREQPTCHRNESGFFGEVACQEAFVYDFGTDSLSCASCNPDGLKPTASVGVPGWSTPYQGPRLLSEDGSRLFFETENALLPEDANSLEDVYEWEAAGSPGCTVGSPAYSLLNSGCIALISSGTSIDNSQLIDASADGSDVFFATRQQLTWEDEDDHFDVYDARVGGGFSQPLAEPVCASAEQCRPSAVGPPSQSSAGTTRLSGSGNPPWVEPCAGLRSAKVLTKRARNLRHRASALGAAHAAQARSLRKKARGLTSRARHIRATCSHSS
jgi:hypothetical protein